MQICRPPEASTSIATLVNAIITCTKQNDTEDGLILKVMLLKFADAGCCTDIYGIYGI